MKKIEKGCEGCSVPSYPCDESTCRKSKEIHIYCDYENCNEDLQIFYEIEGKQYCEKHAFEILYSRLNAYKYINSNSEIQKQFVEFHFDCELKRNSDLLYETALSDELKLYSALDCDELLDFVSEDTDFIEFFCKKVWIEQIDFD